MLINLLRVWGRLVYGKESVCWRSWSQISEASVIMMMFSSEPPELRFQNLN